MITLAVPENQIYRKFYANEAAVKTDGNIKIIHTDEKQCEELLLNHRADAAILTPLAYGRGVKKADYRIIPEPFLSSEGYTALASIFFREGLTTIEKCVSPNPDDFLMLIGKLLLAERYGILSPLEKMVGNIEQNLKETDATICRSRSSLLDNALDISEMWIDSYEITLPLAFWVCRAEEVPENIIEILQSIRDDAANNEEIIIEDEDNQNSELSRSGKLLWKFNDDIRSALEHTIHLLYYHQLLPEIAAVKILE